MFDYRSRKRVEEKQFHIIKEQEKLIVVFVGKLRFHASFGFLLFVLCRHRVFIWVNYIYSIAGNKEDT